MSNSPAHALLSPSSACRWLYCTPSARLTENISDESSVYANEGTLAHELASLKVEKKFTTLKKSEYDARLKAVKDDELYDAEMDRYTNEYVEYITEVAYSRPVMPVVKPETRLELDNYIPESFGTADCMIVSGTDLFVIDFKYGKGIKVEAEGNEQMMLYGLGAYDYYSIMYQIKNVHMTIFQPRIGNLSTAQLLTEDLLEWGHNFVRPQAQKAWAGVGDYSPSDSACQWCLVKGTCNARADKFLDVFRGLEPDREVKPPLLTPERKGEILTLVSGFDKWIKDVEAAALKDALAGEDVTGHKVVEGRSNRFVADEKALVKKLKEAGYKQAVLYEKRLLTLTALEKLVGKKELTELVGEHIDKPQGRPTLVAASDKRPEFEAQKPEVEKLFSETVKGD